MSVVRKVMVVADLDLLSSNYWANETLCVMGVTVIIVFQRVRVEGGLAADSGLGGVTMVFLLSPQEKQEKNDDIIIITSKLL